MKKDTLSYYLFACVVLLVIGGVIVNVDEQRKVDRSKIPEKVELYRGFQRWITNLRNKGFETNADEFKLIEENEIYNTQWMAVYSFDEESEREWFYENLNNHRDIKKVVFSPSDQEFIDYRDAKRPGDLDGSSFEPNEVRFLGQKEDKIIDARILDCSVRANCYFDRAYFLDNDVFVISEFSRNIHKKDVESPECLITDECIYTIKLHIIDLKQNKRLVYESEPFDMIMSIMKKEL